LSSRPKGEIFFKAKAHFLGAFFFLDKKEPTKSRMSDRLRAAFSPPRLGGYCSGVYLFIRYLFGCRFGFKLCKICAL